MRQRHTVLTASFSYIMRSMHHTKALLPAYLFLLIYDVQEPMIRRSIPYIQNGHK